MALVPDQKFSTFQDGGTPTTGDIVVGLRGGINTKFNWVLPASVDAITGTANQVLVNGSSGVPVTGNITLTTPQDIGTTSTPTFAAVITDAIKDVNGVNILEFGFALFAENYLRVNNAIAGAPPRIETLGSDTDISMDFLAKGAGAFTYSTFASSEAIVYQTGTASQHTTNFTFADTAQSRTATWQDSDGTVAWLSDVAGTVTSATGTANQVLVNGTSGTPQTGAITLTLPQDIATTSSPTFLAVTAGNLNIAANAITPINSNGNISLLPPGSGDVLVNTTTSPIPGFDLQVVGVVGSSGHLSSASYNNSTNFANIDGIKSASATVGVHSAVANNEQLMSVNTYADDGTTFVKVASITTKCTAAVSTGIIPTQMQFATTNTSGVLTAAMTISNAQIVSLANALPVGSGGSGRQTNTAFALIAGGTTTGGVEQSLTTGTSGQFLTSAGAAALPTWTTATFPATAGTTGTILRSNGTNWVNSTSTFADTYTASNILYSNGANTVTGLATANNGVLITSAGGVPSISTTLPSGIAATNMNLTTPTLGVASATSINFGGAALNTYSGLTAWTPVLTFSTPGDLSVVYTAQSGQYSRIGNIVRVTFTLNCTPTYTTASGTFQITGLPFAANAATGNNAVGSVVESAIVYPAARTAVNIYLSPSSQILNMYASGTAAAVTQLTTANFTTGVAVLINGAITYMV